MSLSQNIEENLFALEAFANDLFLIEAEAAAALIEAEIARLRLAGLSDEAIVTILQNDFDTRGRIFGQIENAVKAQTAGLISAASNGAQQEVYLDAGVTSDLRRWVVVNLGPGATTKPCPDCPTRQGQIETIETWQTIGEPGSGWSVCGPYDYCILVPVEIDMPDLVDVI